MQPPSPRRTAPTVKAPATTIPPPTTPPRAYPGCEGAMDYIGDALCDPENNNAECEFDGGDCCEYTCKNGAYFACGDSGYNCQDSSALLGEYSNLSHRENVVTTKLACYCRASTLGLIRRCTSTCESASVGRWEIATDAVNGPSHKHVIYGSILTLFGCLQNLVVEPGASPGPARATLRERAMLLDELYLSLLYIAHRNL